MARKPSPRAPKKEEAVAQPTTPTSRERSLAAACHGAIILLPFAVVPSVVIWILEGRSSKYVGSHSAQALVAQAVLDILTGILIIVAAALKALPLVGWLFFYLLAVIVCVLWVAAFVYGIYGALKIIKGEDFRYIIFSDLVGS